MVTKEGVEAVDDALAYLAALGTSIARPPALDTANVAGRMRFCVGRRRMERLGTLPGVVFGRGTIF